MAITAISPHASMKTYTMKQACELTGMNYEALKFYCNSGLVPGVERDQNNRRIFDERSIAWINGLTCLKQCGLGIKEMQHYTQLCLEGESSIPERKEILAIKRRALEKNCPKSKTPSTISTVSRPSTTMCLPEKSIIIPTSSTLQTTANSHHHDTSSLRLRQQCPRSRSPIGRDTLHGASTATTSAVMSRAITSPVPIMLLSPMVTSSRMARFLNVSASGTK